MRESNKEAQMDGAISFILYYQQFLGLMYRVSREAYVGVVILSKWYNYDKKSEDMLIKEVYLA